MTDHVCPVAQACLGEGEEVVVSVPRALRLRMHDRLRRRASSIVRTTKRRLLVLLLITGSAVVPWSVESALAATPPTDLNRSERALVEQLTAKRVAVIIRERRIATEREEKLLRRLEAKDKRLRAIEAKASSTQAQLADAQRERDKLARDRRKLVDQLAARDREFEAEIAAYREAVTGLAQTTNPKKRAALERYANGDRQGAFPILEDITRAENAARAKAAAIASAKNLRDLAPLAHEMKDRGEKTTPEVIALYEEITALDRGVAWDWITLARLYDEGGQLEKARRAAESAVKVSSTARERSAGLNELADVAVKAGDLKEAKRLYEESLGIARRLAKANPGSAEAQRDVSVSCAKLGLVTGQHRYLAEALEIVRKLDATGRLAPSDRSMLAILERLVEEGP